MKRSESRESAFLILFESLFKDEPITDLIILAKESRNFKTDSFTVKLVKGITEKISEIDELIQKKSISWSIDRLSKVVLVALRIAIYEILFEEKIPIGVSINEAVEITKKYSTQEDAAFLNGILGVVAKEFEGK